MAEGDLEVYREVRLRALQDAPRAFGSTHAREISLTDEEWRARLIRFGDPSRGVGFLALDRASGGESGEAGRRACGLIGLIRETEAPQHGHIISMWVAPEARRHGVGARLVAAVETWARGHGVTEMALDVVDDNVGAIQLYRRSGFVETGESTPYAHDASARELRMVKLLRAP